MLLLGNKLTVLTSWKGEFVHDIFEKEKKEVSPITNSDIPLQADNAFGYVRHIDVLT
jgi:hypothetical protein